MNIAPSIQNWCSKHLVKEKLYSVPGVMLVALLSLLLGLVFSQVGMKIGVIIAGVIFGIPVAIACFVYPVIGIALLVILGFLVEFIRKFVAFPAGVAMDGLIALLFAGLILRVLFERSVKFAKSPISILIIIWVFYNFLQVLNPWAASKMAWLYTVRSMAFLILLYFIACHAFKSKKLVFAMLKLVLGMAILSALYGLKQEFFGFTQAELNWLYSDPERFRLIVQWSRFRIFSFSSNPTNFGILMAFMSIFCFILAIGPYQLWKRLIALGGGCCMILAMAYAGSRTPFVLLPAGILFVTIITLKKEIIIGVLIVGLLGTAFMMKSTSNPVIFRIQSAFNLEDSEDTVMVRIRNQKMIQPFVQTHPFGAGLGSTGVWGKRFTPDSWLASFAHDSGYVRIAVELGWVGLIIYMLLLFAVLRSGIYYYLRVEDPKIKNLYLAVTTSIFMLTVANYPQEAIVQLPMSIVFYILLAAIVKLKDFDTSFKSKAYDLPN